MAIKPQGMKPSLLTNAVIVKVMPAVTSRPSWLSPPNFAPPVPMASRVLARRFETKRFAVGANQWLFFAELRWNQRASNPPAIEQPNATNASAPAVQSGLLLCR